jgi:hypothetical protein
LRSSCGDAATLFHGDKPKCWFTETSNNNT